MSLTSVTMILHFPYTSPPPPQKISNKRSKIFRSLENYIYIFNSIFDINTGKNNFKTLCNSIFLCNRGGGGLLQIFITII